MAELPAGTLSKDTFRNEEHDRLKNLTAEATLKYSIHDYDAAAELYSQATELQAKLNGEMSSLNADLLYQYGKCLYHVAVRKSDVLGSRAAGEKSEEGTLESSSTQPLTKRKSTETTGDGPRVAREVISSSIEGRDVSEKRKEQSGNKNKPFFQFTGDENFESYDDEDDMGDGADDEEEAEDEEDDLVTAYEVLDLARVLFLRRLEEAPERDGDPQDLKYLKERLADTYDLQAEISLEGERFPLAVEDLKAALELKMALFPPQSSLIAEAHYKLSLALEFSSVTEQKGLREEDEGGAQAKFDQVMREAAAKEMEAAIGSCKLRMKEEEAKLEAASSSYDDSVKSGAIKRNIEDVKEIVNDMEQRLIELRQPPFSIKDQTAMGAMEGVNPLGGILSSILSESPALRKTKLEAASIGAADVTNLIKRKTVTSSKEIDQENKVMPLKNAAKRKVGYVEEVVDVGKGKKAKQSDAQDE